MQQKNSVHVLFQTFSLRLWIKKIFAKLIVFFFFWWCMTGCECYWFGRAFIDSTGCCIVLSKKKKNFCNWLSQTCSKHFLINSSQLCNAYSILFFNWLIHSLIIIVQWIHEKKTAQIAILILLIFVYWSVFRLVPCYSVYDNPGTVWFGHSPSADLPLHVCP